MYFKSLFIVFQGMSPLSVFAFVAYILASLTVIGLMFDRKPGAVFLELVRCLIFGILAQSYLAGGWNSKLMLPLQLFYVTSAFWWCLYGFNIVEIKKQNKTD